MELSEIPVLTRNFYEDNKNSLTGWFLLIQMSIDNFIGPLHGYVLFKNGQVIKYCQNRGSNNSYKKFFEGKLHCEDGPAHIESNNNFLWTGSDFILDEKAAIQDCYYYKFGKRHRLDGPAIDTRRDRGYYVDGVSYQINSFLNHPDVIEYNNKRIVLELIKNS